MARTPIPRQTESHLLDLDPEAVQQDLSAANTLVTLKAGINADRDLLNQLLGQAQAFQAAGNLLQTFGVSKLAFVKENKLYQQLNGMHAPNGLELKGTWVEFCDLLGISDEKANQDIANLKSFGESALESMSRMGIGYRDLRQFRKLPEDAKPLLIEAAKSGDKDAFMDLAEELVERHVKQKTELEGQLAEARATLDARDRVLTKKSDRISELEEQVSRKFVPDADSQARNLEEQAVLDAIGVAGRRVQMAMRKVFVTVDTVLGSSARDAVQLQARQTVEALCQQLVDMAAEFGIAVDFEQRLRPSWMDDDLLAAMEARHRATGVDAAEDDADGDSDGDAAPAANVHHLPGSALR